MRFQFAFSTVLWSLPMVTIRWIAQPCILFGKLQFGQTVFAADLRCSKANIAFQEKRSRKTTICVNIPESCLHPGYLARVTRSSNALHFLLRIRICKLKVCCESPTASLAGQTVKSSKHPFCLTEERQRLPDVCRNGFFFFQAFSPHKSRQKSHLIKSY